MASAFNKFRCFVGDVGLKLHDLNTDTLKVMLTNEQPLVADTVKGDMTEVSAGYGYNAGGEDAQNAFSQSGGVGTLTGVDIVWTANGGTIGPFQFAVLYNSTPATKYLIGWWDYGTSITLQIGETFTVDFGASILTLT
jgi:hypothetical protein